MKKIGIIIVLIFITTWISAQSAHEALRYSQLQFGGSARSMSMGGAFGALGADPSVLSTNPGGIGLFKKSTLTLTPSFMVENTETDFLNNKRDENKYNFHFNNLSAIFHINTGTTSKFKDFQFGIGINRLANFAGKMRIKGDNRDINGTIMAAYYDHATLGNTTDLQLDELQNNYDLFGAYLAYEANLLYDTDTVTPGMQWGYDAIYGGTSQHKMVKTLGSIDEIFMSFGGNFMDKLYVGATVGIQSLDYQEKNNYYETDVNDTIPFFNSLYKYDDLNTSASGINLKLGAIYRALPWLRLGFAYHTPTYWGNMEDMFSARMESNLTFDPDEGAQTFKSNTSQGNFEYSMVTPSRMIASIAFQIKKYGLISAEYESVNYSAARFDADMEDFNYLNDEISDKFKRQSNIRIGTEWRLSNFYIRGGFAYYGSPYTDSNYDASRTFMTGGLGYRSKYFGLDVGYVHSTYQNQYYIYDARFAPITDVKHSNNQFVVTTTFAL